LFFKVKKLVFKVPRPLADSRLTWEMRFDKLIVMKCDTCGKETKEVRRVIVDTGYDRTLARPLYNCPECYEKKEQAKKTKR